MALEGRGQALEEGGEGELGELKGEGSVLLAEFLADACASDPYRVLLVLAQGSSEITKG